MMSAISGKKNDMRKILIAAGLLLALSSVAQAQSTAPVVEPGGCANGAFLSGTAYPTMDATGRGCSATSPSTLGWYTYNNITTDTKTTVKSGAGVLHTITFNNPAATEVVTIFDNTAASGTKIGTITTPASPVPVTITYDVNFATGLTLLTATAAGDITVSFK